MENAIHRIVSEFYRKGWKLESYTLKTSDTFTFTANGKSSRVQFFETHFHCVDYAYYEDVENFCKNIQTIRSTSDYDHVLCKPHATLTDFLNDILEIDFDSTLRDKISSVSKKSGELTIYDAGNLLKSTFVHLENLTVKSRKNTRGQAFKKFEFEHDGKLYFFSLYDDCLLIHDFQRIDFKYPASILQGYNTLMNLFNK
jgi:hypothetical protein